MSTNVTSKIMAFTLINCILCSQVLGKSELPSMIDDLKNSYIEKDELIEFKLFTGKKIAIKFIEKTENFIKGYLVRFDQGTERTMNEEVKINYDEIKTYQIIYKTTRDQSKAFYFLIGFTIVFVIILINVFEKGIERW